MLSDLILGASVEIAFRLVQATSLALLVYNLYAYWITLRPGIERLRRRKNAISRLKAMKDARWALVVAWAYAAYRATVFAPSHEYVGSIQAWVEKAQQGAGEQGSSTLIWNKKFYRVFAVGGLYLVLVLIAVVHQPMAGLAAAGQFILRKPGIITNYLKKFTLWQRAHYTIYELTVLFLHISSILFIFAYWEHVPRIALVPYSALIIMPLIHNFGGIFWNTIEFLDHNFITVATMGRRELMKTKTAVAAFFGFAVSPLLSALAISVGASGYIPTDALIDSRVLVANGVLDAATFLVTFLILENVDFSNFFQLVARGAIDLLLSFVLSVAAAASVLLMVRPESIGMVFKIALGSLETDLARASSVFLLTHSAFIPVLFIIAVALTISANMAIMKLVRAGISLFTQRKERIREVVGFTALLAGFCLAASTVGLTLSS